MKRNPGVIGALGAMVLLAVVVTAQAQTRTIFQRISTTLVGDGYTRVGPPRSGWLDDDETAQFTVWLTAGTSYVVAAACDVDCSDVDLQLFSPSGDEVDRDFLSDDEPMVFAAPYTSGRYTVRVSMARCAREPCEYYAGVFQQ